MYSSDVQRTNAPEDNSLTLSGISIYLRLEQSLNAQYSTHFKPSGNLTLSKLEHP